MNVAFTLSDGTPVYDAGTIRIRCNQNRIFGCGQLASVPVVRFTLPGTTRDRLSGGGRCQCGLPLSVARNA